jgi:hypothetical protein
MVKFNKYVDKSHSDFRKNLGPKLLDPWFYLLMHSYELLRCSPQFRFVHTFAHTYAQPDDLFRLNTMIHLINRSFRRTSLTFVQFPINFLCFYPHRSFFSFANNVKEFINL